MRNKFKRALGPMLRPTRTPTSAATPFTAAPSHSTMRTHSAGVYNTGIPEEVAEQKAAEDGQAGILDPSTVGDNSHPHAIEGLVHGHDCATSVIGHGLQDTVQDSDDQLNHLLEAVKKTAADAIEAIAEHTSAMRQWLVQRHKMRSSGTSRPTPKRHRRLLLTLLLLFAGDWGLLALGFQIMGLSDRPWISFLPFTDDLHLAALSAVMALVYLGHIVGEHVRNIQHALEVRRQAGEDRDKFPKPATFDYVWSITAFGTAMIGMLCLSAIRASYLKAIGVDANFWAFVGVQFLILAAAIGVSFSHAVNREAEKFEADEAELVAATIKRDEAVNAHVARVGPHNALIDRRLADMALAGHHVNADAANVAVQIAAVKRRYILSQAEPAQQRLFGEHKTPTEYEDGELLKRLTGVTPFPEFVKVMTQEVMDALAAAEEEISTLRARIDQVEINKLDLPDVSELFTSTKAAAAETVEEDPATITAPEVESTHEGATDVTTEVVGSGAAKLHPVSLTAGGVGAVDADDDRESA